VWGLEDGRKLFALPYIFSPYSPSYVQGAHCSEDFFSRSSLEPQRTARSHSNSLPPQDAMVTRSNHRHPSPRSPPAIATYYLSGPAPHCAHLFSSCSLTQFENPSFSWGWRLTAHADPGLQIGAAYFRVALEILRLTFRPTFAFSSSDQSLASWIVVLPPSPFNPHLFPQESPSPPLEIANSPPFPRHRRERTGTPTSVGNFFLRFPSAFPF